MNQKYIFSDGPKRKQYCTEKGIDFDSQCYEKVVWKQKESVKEEEYLIHLNEEKPKETPEENEETPNVVMDVEDETKLPGSVE